MRNLKRALSLALAAMMLIGMMVVSAGAASKDFTDKDEIQHTEAVNTLVALNVIAGKGDGSSFDPNGTLTRAEMAKLITYVLNGGVEPVLGTKVTPTYSDIKGHWAESYIEYCTSMNIIVGDGTGKFNPEGTLTASQCAKMLLTAMNYKDSVFGFTGNSWEINVNREANAAGLYKDLGSIQASQPISRDNAAQMVYNAVQSKTMKLSWSQDMTTGQITQQYTLTGNSLLVDKFGVTEDTGVLTAVSYNADKGEYTYTVGGNSYTTTSDCSYLYQMNTKVLYKTSSGKTTVYGIFADNSSVVASGLVSDITAPGATADKVKIGSTEYKLTGNAGAVGIYEFLAGAQSNTLDKVATYATTSNKKVAYTFDLIDNTGDGKGDVVVVYPYAVEKVTYVGTKSFTAGSSYKFEDVTSYTGLAKNDWVKITPAANTANNTTVVEKLNLVSAKAEAVKVSDGKVQFNGEWYKTALVTAPKAGDSCEYVAVNGYLFYVNTTSSTLGAADFVVVTARADNAAGLSNTYTTKILKSDGTTAVVEATTQATAGTLYTYKVNDDGNYVLSAAPTASVSTTTDYDNAFASGTYNAATSSAKGSVTASGTTYYIADDAVVFVNDGTNYSVTTGAKLKDTSSSVTVSYVAVKADSASGYSYVKLAYVTSAALGKTTNSYAYVTGDVVKYQDTTDDTKFYVEIPVGDGQTLTTVSKTAGGSTVVDTAYGLTKGDVIKYTVNGDGKVDTITKYTMGNLAATTGAIDFTAAIVGYSDSNIRFSGDFFTKNDGTKTGKTDLYDATITDDTVIVYVDSSEKAVMEGGSIQLASNNLVNGNTSNYANAKVVTNASKEVVLLVIDVNNDILGVQ